jgi:CubicO group peptidase (beta-lactamase class C family)
MSDGFCQNKQSKLKKMKNIFRELKIKKKLFNLINFFPVLLVIIGVLFVSCGNKQDLNDKNKKLEDLFNYYYENGLFNGAVLIAYEEKVIYKKALGYANFETNTKLSINSVFNIGSVTKQFTSMAIMILKESGKLSFDDKFSTFFPDFPKANKFTIRQLLTHTAGIPNFTVSRRFPEFRVPGRPGDFIDGISQQDVHDFLVELDSLDFEPGERYAYSNSGYVLLSLVVEKVSGIPFRQFLKENIFIPLKMSNSLVWDNSKPEINGKAIGYNDYGDKDDNNLLTAGDGGVYSTIEDMYKWDIGLFENKLVSKETFSEAVEIPHLNNDSPSRVQTDSTWNYGFGWLFRINDKDSIIWHDGGLNGCSAIFYRDLNKRFTIILLSNKGSNGPLYPIHENILNILNHEHFTFTKIPISIKLKSLIDSLGIESAVSKFNEIKLQNETSYNSDVNQLNRLGYYYINKQKLEEAKFVFQLNMNMYPNDANVYDSYAESLMLSGDNENSIKYYKKSLELNPNNENAINMLKRIENEK